MTLIFPGSARRLSRGWLILLTGPGITRKNRPSYKSPVDCHYLRVDYRARAISCQNTGCPGIIRLDRAIKVQSRPSNSSFSQSSHSYRIGSNLQTLCDGICHSFEHFATRLYAGLVSDADLRERVWGMLADEFERTRRVVLSVTDQGELLKGNPVLARSIRLRNPYVDPMSLVQVELLRRKRAGGNPEGVDYALGATINGIAAGLHNTG